MTILIKGMEMPENCIYCPVVDDEYGGCLIDDKSHGDPNKPIDCPLIEVPTPHGRLADADALLTDANKLRYGEGWLITVENIEAAPTVIEAEE